MTDRIAMGIKTLDRMEFVVFDGSSKLSTCQVNCRCSADFAQRTFPLKEPLRSFASPKSLVEDWGPFPVPRPHP